MLPFDANLCYNKLLCHEGVIETGYDFMYKRLSMPKFFTSQWLHVRKFTEALDSMDKQGSRIDDNSVIPVMEKILGEVSDEETIDGVAVNTLRRGLEMLKQVKETEAMDSNWFIKKFGEIYNRVMSLRKNDDYVVNPRQMDRFLDLVNFFLHHTEEGDSVEIEENEPKNGFGGVTATFLVMTLRNEEVSEFCKVLKCCSAVSIDSCDDGACISCTVPNVFVRKDE